MPAISSEDVLSGRNQADTIRLAKFQDGADRAASADDSLQSEDPQGLGVFYCELSVDNGSAVTIDDASAEKSL